MHLNRNFSHQFSKKLKKLLSGFQRTSVYGYDLDMTQREIRYAAIPDLRTEFHPGSEIDCIVKEYHPRTGELIVSAKETEVNPFFGAEERHPVGSRRFAMISGKYGGGVLQPP